MHSSHYLTTPTFILILKHVCSIFNYRSYHSGFVLQHSFGRVEVGGSIVISDLMLRVINRSDRYLLLCLSARGNENHSVVSARMEALDEEMFHAIEAAAFAKANSSMLGAKEET